MRTCPEELAYIYNILEPSLLVIVVLLPSKLACLLNVICLEAEALACKFLLSSIALKMGSKIFWLIVLLRSRYAKNAIA